MMKTRLVLVALAWIVSSRVLTARDPETKPAIRISLAHPDQQLEEVLKLFQGAKAKSPAAALAAWKRASPEPNWLGKPVEALIAAINPRMVEELKTLDGAEVSIRFDPEFGQAQWSAILPKDDGAVSALASALVLSGGAADPPLGDIAVDRLAGPGSPLMARLNHGTLIASDRLELKFARQRIENPRAIGEVLRDHHGLKLQVEPGSLRGSRSFNVRRLAELIDPSVLPNHKIDDAQGAIQANLELENGVFSAKMRYSGQLPSPKVSIDPDWFDWTPKVGAFSSFALATDPAAPSWEAFFALADRIEKVDPSRANMASLGVRIDLLARLSGIRLETDLLFHLQGVSGWLGSTDSRAINNAFFVLHLDNQEAAERIVAGMKPIPGSGPRPAGDPVRPRWLGTIDGQPLRIARSVRDVVIGWGEDVVDVSLAAHENPGRSAGAEIRGLIPFGPRPLSGGVVWPERIPGLGQLALPQAGNVEAIDPIVWIVQSERENSLSLNLTWLQVNKSVNWFLDRIPLSTPPDH